MLIAVDGTGPWNDDQYAIEMNNSFVSKVHSEAQGISGVDKFYQRGPTLLGFETGPIAQMYFNTVKKAYQKAEQEKGENEESDFKLYLTGYSRGAASVIGLANLLNSTLPNLKIEFMALFDAVDRSPISNVDKIPRNVKTCYHAIRDKNAGSRTYFGNCGLLADPPASLLKKTFFATHAGMGGIPWTGDHPTETIANPDFNMSEYLLTNRFDMHDRSLPSNARIEVPMITKSQDVSGSSQVQMWMWAAMKECGMLG
jgi:hypothetical protein